MSIFNFTLLSCWKNNKRKFRKSKCKKTVFGCKLNIKGFPETMMLT